MGWIILVILIFIIIVAASSSANNKRTERGQTNMSTSSNKAENINNKNVVSSTKAEKCSSGKETHVKCPVCKTDILSTSNVCSTCGFTEIHKEFINSDDAITWFDTTVIPYRQKWNIDKHYQELSSESASSLYAKLGQSQFSQVENFVKKDVKLFSYEKFQDGIEITSYNGTQYNVVVPENIDGLPVRRLGKRLFAECRDLFTVKLPSSLREIGEEAFYHSTVNSVNIPALLTKIEKSAFRFTKITEITFPENVTIVSEHVCSGCEKLHTVVILGANKIENGAFGGCYALNNLFLPNTLEFIGQAVFSNTFPLTKIVVPASVKKIGMNFAKISSGGVLGGAQAQTKHIAILNDDVEWEYSFGSYSGLQQKYDQMLIYYCNNGSTTQKLVREKHLVSKPLSQYPY